MRRHLAHVVTQVAGAVDLRARAPQAHDEALDRLRALVPVLRADHPEADADEDADTDRVAALAEIFGLDALDVRLLMVAVAPDVDANLGTALDLLGGSGPTAMGGHVALGTALELCGLGSGSAEARARLHPSAPLRRHRLLLVHGDGPWLGRTLQAPDRVVGHLVGDDTPDPLVAAMTVPAGGVDLPEAHSVARAVELGVRLVYVRSPLGAPGAAVAAGAFGTLGIRPLVVDLRRRPAETGGASAVAVAAREAGMVGAGLVVLGVDDAIVAAPDQPADLSVVEALGDAAVPVVGVGHRGWDRGWSRDLPLCVEATRLPPAVRGQVWDRELPGADLAAAEWRDVVGLRLEPGDVASTVRYARMLGAVRDEPVGPALVREAARRLGGGAGGRLPGRTSATLSDLVLPDTARQQVAQLISWAQHRDAVLAQGPVHGQGGKGSGLAALFSGGPGTGKTLAAHVVSDALGLDLYPVDLSSVVDKYVGETEKNLERVFHEAESLNVVLFFDEADSLFGSRSEVRDSRDRYANLEVSYLLQRMEQFDGIVLLATNLRANLDAAFSRRLHFVIHFPDPDVPTRRSLWRQHLTHLEPLDASDPVDFDLLAEGVELAGGDIRNIVMAAAYDAAAAGGRIGMRTLAAAARREYAKLGRRMPPGGFADIPPPAPALPGARG
ncbi:ATP-binding protein [Cellulomonas cellasea]|uniref:ATP-binding protein n=1 Tax=Cellulomonas cellasea TaxID=43670 RepID=UPI0025A4B446|nr:ATP-binding protein [Cellulomonas cellasea]MDM8083991.1 ATP-binding protein [Cellulomonas cellasea]